ncbi:MAG TPA: apolipoprotein N-acyltransferase [Terriglobia bacterium]|nr:apolipoprotein N-acyltransferase [Terriglobia bacterium]
MAGGAWALAYPTFNVAGLAWLAPALMLGAAFGASPGTAFRLGYVTGLTQSLVTLHWLLFIPVKFAPVLGWLALSAYCALYPAAWLWFCRRICPGVPPREFRSGGDLERAIESFMAAGWWRRSGWALACAVAWVAGEMVLARLFTGFPWAPLGVTQHRMLPVIQFASVTGVYGVSFMMVWLSAALFCAGVSVLPRSPARRPLMLEVFVPMLALLGLVTSGLRPLLRPALPGETVKLALIQPSIPQTMIWDPAESTRRFQALLQLSEHAATNRPDVLIWPEAAVPSLLRWDTNIYQPVIELARRRRVWLIMGADDAERSVQEPSRIDYFNSSFLVTPRGEVAATYRKRRLVIFGEYVPLRRWLPFLKYLTPIEGGFTPGTGVVPFALPELGLNVSVLICFEDVFPHLVRHYVNPDTDFLLNLTNNGWFGESAAHWQHAAAAVFRAVENGVPLVRCANNGISCWIDAQGRMNDVFFPGSANVYQPGIKVVTVPTRSDGLRGKTLYRRYGDWFGWMCVVLTAALAGGRVLHRERRP